MLITAYQTGVSVGSLPGTEGVLMQDRAGQMEDVLALLQRNRQEAIDQIVQVRPLRELRRHADLRAIIAETTSRIRQLYGELMQPVCSHRYCIEIGSKRQADGTRLCMYHAEGTTPPTYF